MRKPQTSTTRSIKQRAANKAAGGSHINTRISPEAARALARLRESMGLRQSVEQALIALAKTAVPSE